MFKSFLKNKTDSNQKDDSDNLDDKVFSLACVLIEAAMADESFGEDEKRVINRILMKHFKISKGERLKNIIDKAIKNFDESSDLITHTKIIKENWPLDDRIEVIEMLWKVCLIDGVLEPYEDMLIRRVSGLIYVNDKNRKIAKNRALDQIESDEKG